MNKQILRLAIPNIISNLAIPLLGAVDTALMGRLEAETYLGGVAVGGIIFNFIYWGFGFLRMATTGLVAQAYGAADDKECGHLLARGILVALVGSVTLIALQYPIAAVSFRLIESSAEVERLGRQYFHIRVYAAPATLCLHVFHGVFLGMQNAKYPMILTIAGNGLNLAFNLLFVLGLGMTTDGVALGTVITQYLGLGFAVVLFMTSYRPVIKGLRIREIAHPPALKKFLRISGDIFIRTLCLVFGHSFFTAKSAAVSDAVLAVNTILFQFIYILSFGVDGLAFAAESLVGKYKGAGDRENLKKVVGRLFTMSMLLGGIFSVIFGLFGEALLRLFTDQQRVIDQAGSYLIWLALAPIVNVPAYIWDGVFLGVTASKAMRNAMIVSTFVIFLPMYYLLRPLGNHGLWMALTVYAAARGLSLTVLAPKHIFRGEW